MRCKIVAVLTALALGGCATSPKGFATNRHSMSDSRLCRTLASALDGNDTQFAADVAEEAHRRGLNVASCEKLVRDQNIGIGLAAALAAIAVAAARRGGGGGGTASSDYTWDWDQFQNAYGQLVWSCRGVQTGQFADLWRCNGLAKTDYRWPGLARR